MTLKNAAPTPFEEAYLEALRAVVALDEEKAGFRLNKVARLLDSPSEPMGTPAVEGIKENLRGGRLLNLYGDYKAASEGKATTPWIRDQAVLSMIADHLIRIGDLEDVLAYNDFAQRCTQAFTTPRPAGPKL